MPVESYTQALPDLALRFGEDNDEQGGMVRSYAKTASLLVMANRARSALTRFLLCNQ